MVTMRRFHPRVAGRDAVSWLHLALLLLFLILTWLGGGVAEDSTSVDEWLQLLALPVLVMSAAILLEQPPTDPLTKAAFVVLVLILLVPVLQLLPWPEPIWAAGSARASMARDLSQAGVATVSHLGTLAPQATERGLWSLLPAVAVFLGALVVPKRLRRLAVLVVIGMVLLNVAFAFQQAGLPRDSDLRLYRYPDGSEVFGGLLVNHNHHATALLVGASLSLGLGIDAWRRRQGSQPFGMYLWHVGVALFCLFVIPLTGSRAGIALALPTFGAVLLLAGVLPLGRILAAVRERRALLAIPLLVLAAGVWLMHDWMAGIMAADPRFAVADATFAMGASYLPFGSGIGSFVEAFAQNAPNLLMMPVYANHAHNEYAEWWMTGGLPAMLALGGVLGVLVQAGLRLLRLQGRCGDSVLAASCLVAIGATLVHSWVDYPLRTTTMMTTVSLVAGVMLASLADAQARWRGHPRRQAQEVVQ